MRDETDYLDTFTSENALTGPVTWPMSLGPIFRGALENYDGASVHQHGSEPDLRTQKKSIFTRGNEEKAQASDLFLILSLVAPGPWIIFYKFFTLWYNTREIH